MARFLDWPAAVGLVLLAALLSIYAADHAPRVTLAHSDFVPFYCAGAVTLAGANSDLTKPLEACERAAAASVAPSVSVPPGSVNPAPLPGYDIAFLTLLARLPFPLAVVLWEVALLLAILATVRVLQALTGLPHFALAACLLGTEVVACVTFGQLAPFATLALALAAFYVARDRPRPAALAALATLIQPQLGLPVVLALFIWQPRARTTLAFGIVLLGALSLSLLGFERNLAYLRSVLPAQGAAEVPYRIQYSLSWLLYALGLDETRAGQAGVLDYGLLLALGVGFAGRTARTLEAPAALVTFPAAAVLAGGSYVHPFQVCGAVPFALVLATTQGPRLRGLRVLAWTGRALLAVPWQDLAARLGLALGAVALATVIVTALQGQRAVVRGLAAAVAVFLMVGFLPTLERLPATDLRPPPTAASFAARGFDPALASTQHGTFVRQQPGWTASGLPVLLEKVPLWLGLWGLLGAGMAAGLGRSQSRVKISQAFGG